MPTLHLLTHPEATHVMDGLVGGWYDADLTERGEQQARAVAAEMAARLAPARAAGARVVVVSSDLVRCRRAAELVAAALGGGVGVRLDRGLREQSYGAAEGRPVGSCACRPPTADDDPLHHHDGVPGSETRWQVAVRVHDSVREHLGTAPEHLVLVTHGGAATYVVTAFLGLAPEAVGPVRFVMPPGSISTLRLDPTTGDRRVEALGDVGHLERSSALRG